MQYKPSRDYGLQVWNKTRTFFSTQLAKETTANLHFSYETK